jgi:hypothetical protein
MTTYRVVVDGRVLPGFAGDDVRRKLAALIGRSDDAAAKLLGGNPSTVKRGVDAPTALRYVETLNKIGVSSRLEPEVLELDLDAPHTASQSAPRVAAAQPAPAPTPTSSTRVPAEDSPTSSGGIKAPPYVASVLGKNELALYQARLSLTSYWFWFVLGGCLLLIGLLLSIAAAATKGVPAGFGLGCLAVGALFFVRPIVARLTTELVITNRRIIAKWGLVRRSTMELNLSKIESIRVEQGLFARLLNYGDILVIGTGGSNEPIPRISRPLEFRRRYDEILTDSQR